VAINKMAPSTSILNVHLV